MTNQLNKKKAWGLSFTLCTSTNTWRVTKENGTGLLVVFCFGKWQIIDPEKWIKQFKKANCNSTVLIFIFKSFSDPFQLHLLNQEQMYPTLYSKHSPGQKWDAWSESKPVIHCRTLPVQCFNAPAPLQGISCRYWNDSSRPLTAPFYPHSLNLKLQSFSSPYYASPYLLL